MPPRKKLIEVALPLEAINEASAREKSIRHGHPSTLHLWWARRPLAACRAVIFSSLVDDPDDPEAPKAFVDACKKLPAKRNTLVNDTPRMRLFDFIETLVQWESTTDENVLEIAHKLILLATNGNPPPLLDPFAGGGSIPMEAQRLGLETHASDLNPVAVMINKAQIEIPSRFADRPPVNPRDRARIGSDSGWTGAKGLAADVRYYGEWMRDRASERIGHLYPKLNNETVIAWLWARTVKCPNPVCGAQMPLVSSFELSKKKLQSWVEPIINEQAKTVSFKVHTGQGKAPEPPKLGRGAKFRCLVCGTNASEQHIKDEGMAKRIKSQLMAIVTEGLNGRNYHTPIHAHVKILEGLSPSWFPNGELADDPRNIWCKQYGLIEYTDLFTERQLVALTTLSDLINEARQQIFDDALLSDFPNDNVRVQDSGSGARAYAEAVCVYLAFAVDKLADYSSSLCSWHSSGEKMRNTFGRQAIPMVWDYAEVNPFSESSGNWLACIEWVWKALERTPAKLSGVALQQDATQLNQLEPIVVSTDPPYYDNIAYADLSDFFYVWLRRNLRDIYPSIFGTITVPKATELVATPYRFGGSKSKANQFFEDGMSSAFARMRHFTKPEYPLTVYYAFKQQEGSEVDGSNDITAAIETRSSSGWETMLTALIQSGFVINGTYPMRTELGNRMVSMGTNALASSIIIVCRPRPDDASTISRRGFVDALRREVPAALKELQSGNIAPVDLAQASIGPGMAIYSRYKAVLEADGSPLSVRTALQLINQELDAYLAEQEGDVDADTRFALSWFEQFGFDEGAFGQADVLARAKNTSVQGVVEAFVARAGQGKVQLYTPTELYEYNANWSPAEDKRATVWEATHHLIERLNRHSESGAAMLVAKMPDQLSAEARALAYRLYNICERKGWTDYARDYNALVISWPQITALAVEQKNEPTQASLFGEE